MGPILNRYKNIVVNIIQLKMSIYKTSFIVLENIIIDFLYKQGVHFKTSQLRLLEI